jgi:hypothetical protein
LGKLIVFLPATGCCDLFAAGILQGHLICDWCHRKYYYFRGLCADFIDIIVTLLLKQKGE